MYARPSITRSHNDCKRFFFCKQKTAYEMRISYWSSDVCSSDLARGNLPFTGRVCRHAWLDNMLLNDSVDRSNVGAMSDLADYMPVEPGLNVGHELGVPRHRRWLCDMPLERHIESDRKSTR